MARNRCGWLGIVVLVALTAACGVGAGPASPGGQDVNEADTLDQVAEAYVKLVLAAGRHDEDFVDAYYGPEAWRDEVERQGMPLPEVARVAELLTAALGEHPHAGDELSERRRASLRAQVRAVAGRISALVRGRSVPFDHESRVMYDAVAPEHPDEHFERLLADLEPLLPGDGPLHERYSAFRESYVIPPGKLDAVFREAIEACKRRTAEHIELPADESFDLEYVTDKPWSGYNWYKGGYTSLIQVNTDLPIYIDRAVDLACHEGYPGHHVFNVLLEQRLVRERGWIEYQIYPLFSPQSLIAEGTANFGIEMAFPGDERVRFERERLFPLAGLDPKTAARYYEVQALAEGLNYAGNEAARRYLDGKIDAAAASSLLQRFSLMSPERADQRVRFIERYRSYVINYNLGQDLVRTWIERQAGNDTAKRWQLFEDLLSTPHLPSSLR